MADFVPAAAVSGGDNAFYFAEQNRQQPHLHRRRRGGLRADLLFVNANGIHFSGETSVNWLTIGGLNVDFGLKLDALSMMMLFVVTGVGGLIHIIPTATWTKMRASRAFSRS